MAIRDLLKSDKLFKRLLFLGGLFLSLFFVFGLTKEIVNRRQFDRRIADYESQIERIKIENSILNEKIETWDNSTELEGNVRIKLGLEKPGEKTVIILREDKDNEVLVKDNQSLVSLKTEKVIKDYQSNPSKWWNYFFNFTADDNSENNN